MEYKFTSEQSNGSKYTGYIIFSLFLLAAILIWGLKLNQVIFYKINQLHTLLPDYIWQAANIIAYTKFAILPIILLLLTFFFRRSKLLNVILAIVLFFVIFWGFKKIFGEARPIVVLPHDSFFWLKFIKETSLSNNYMSFPSGHTGNMAVFVFSLMGLFFPRSKLARLVLFLLLIFVGVARICTGWHWPLDVIISGMVGYLIVKIARV